MLLDKRAKAIWQCPGFYSWAALESPRGEHLRPMGRSAKDGSNAVAELHYNKGGQLNTRNQKL